MKLAFWRKSKARPVRGRAGRVSARYGGMQERELQTRLEIPLDAVVTRKRSVIESARAMTAYSLVEQERFLAAVDRIARISPELGYRFCCSAPPAVGLLNDEQWQPWVDRVLQQHSSAGMDAASAFMNDLAAYRKQLLPAASSVALDEVAGILRHFLQGLGGGAPELTGGDRVYIDNVVLHLPAQIDRYPDSATNFRLYKALAAHQWAQIQFGTWRVDRAALGDRFPDAERALRQFHHLETVRLDAGIRRTWPGLAGEMARFKGVRQHYPPLWAEAVDRLRERGATAEDSLYWLSRLYHQDWEPLATEYQGGLLPLSPEGAVNNDDRSLPAEATGTAPAATAGDAGPTDAAGSPVTGDWQDSPDNVKPPESVPGYNAQAQNDSTDSLGTKQDAGGSTTNNEYRYDEWDNARQCYRKAWCCLQEQTVEEGGGAFAARTLAKYRGLLRQLRHTFALLQQEYRLLKREPYGDDVDIDALVEACADVRRGLESSDRLYVRTSRDERNVAVIFMVDMSASTAGWTNQVEREALVLLCEALESLDDRYAIYGFSGTTRAACRVYGIKAFDERYSETVRGRIGRMQAQHGTRMGAAVRHLSEKLSRVEARTRLLMVLSDGRPDDLDGYRGAYGIEDTRKALIEARARGMHAFCVTIDRDARDYLPHMFGANNFAVIDQVGQLPRRVGDIYRRLTT